MRFIHYSIYIAHYLPDVTIIVTYPWVLKWSLVVSGGSITTMLKQFKRKSLERCADKHYLMSPGLHDGSPSEGGIARVPSRGRKLGSSCSCTHPCRLEVADEVINVVGDSGLQRVHYWESVTFCFIGNRVERELAALWNAVIFHRWFSYARITQYLYFLTYIHWGRSMY